MVKSKSTTEQQVKEILENLQKLINVASAPQQKPVKKSKTKAASNPASSITKAKSTPAKSKEKFNVKSAITQEIIESLEVIGSTWHKDWKCMGVPMSADKNRPYKGINFLILTLKQMAKGYESNKWVTYNNLIKLGGELSDTGLIDDKGKKIPQRSTMVTLYAPITVSDKKSGEEKNIPYLKYYSVFNLDQTTLKDDDRFSDLLTDLDPSLINKDIEKLIHEFNCPIQFIKQDSASYSPSMDKITMPLKKQFSNYHAMYATVLHEMAHATGHKSRLNRLEENNKSFENKKESYAFEELVAELSSMFLLATYHIDNEAIKDNNKAYIKGWLTALKSDKDYIFKASRCAQKAFEYIDKSQAYVTQRQEVVEAV